MLQGAAPVQQGAGRIFHTVRAGESVSLICIDYYGYYSPLLGKTIIADNPSVKNIDIIHPGQKLSLRKPVDASAGTVKKSGMQTEATLTPLDAHTDSMAVHQPHQVRKMSISQGVVTCVEGTANWRRTATAPLQPLKINTVVAPGSVIETGADGRVEIIINREAVVRLRENSKTVLEAFRTSAGGTSKTRLGCSGGSWWTKVKKFKDRISRFELELPTAVAGVHGTVYETTVAGDGSSEVKVFSGEVAVSSAAAAATPAVPSPAAGAPVEVGGPHEVAPPQEVSMEQWTEIVRSMQRITIDNTGRPSRPESFTRADNGWERWNAQRDLRIAEMFRE